jgi:hypothetical protein
VALKDSTTLFFYLWPTSSWTKIIPRFFEEGFFLEAPGGFGRKKVDATSEKKKKKRSAVESFGDDVHLR